MLADQALGQLVLVPVAGAVQQDVQVARVDLVGVLPRHHHAAEGVFHVVPVFPQRRDPRVRFAVCLSRQLGVVDDADE
eukprot:1785585-Lingulodinium_polyedra.AAC.1